MPTFAYVATAPDGKKLTGTSEATSPNELRQRLSEQGYKVQNVKQSKAAAKPAATKSSAKAAASWTASRASSSPTRPSSAASSRP
jgi:type II secretory pathway component PulF